MRIGNKKAILGGIAILIGAFAILQLLPFGPEYDNPPVVREPAWDSKETRNLVERGCFDCHSNETVWPWYSRIAPMSWMLWRDVQKGREALNFSEWTPQHRQEVDTEEAVELVEKGEMPLPYYIILHPEADFTQIEQGKLVNGLIDTLQRDGDNLEEEDLENSTGSS